LVTVASLDPEVVVLVVVVSEAAAYTAVETRMLATTAKNF
jgi:hypothetical protein